MLDKLYDEEAFAKLIKLKSQLAQNLRELQDERSSLKQDLLSIREEKYKLRKRKANELIKGFNLRVNLQAAQHQLNIQEGYIKDSTNKIDNFMKEIKDEVNLVKFKSAIDKLINSIEGAINLYQEDSIQCELLKRSSIVRAKRIELTDIEKKYQELSDRLEEQKKEKEQARLNEAERQKRIEANKLQADRIKLRDQLSNINSLLHPFLNLPSLDERPSL